MSSQLPDSFADDYMKEFGVVPPVDVVTHCRRELYHAVIRLILEGRFAEAYKHGVVIEFPDGIYRRVFPRFYSYSADYPEKSANRTMWRRPLPLTQGLPTGF